MGCMSSNAQLRFENHLVLKQDKIAEGAYGDIWKCRDVARTDNQYALKEIKLQNSELETMYSKEVSILKKLSLSRVRGSVCLKDTQVSVEGKQKIGSLLFEFGTTTLLDELKAKTFSQIEILTILRDICQSLDQLHSLGIIHLDLKAQNLILVDNRYKICDFGSAMEGPVDVGALDRKQLNSFAQYIDANSTLIYRSPEMVDPLGKVIGAASDIWMLGCIAYLLTFRKHPFEGQGKLAIISGNVRYPKEGFLTQITRQMLTVDYKARPTAKALRQKIQTELSSRKSVI